MKIAIKRTVDLPHAEAIERATEELAKEGFGVLTTIDIQAKMKEKLGHDMDPYVILGACAPPLAWEALGAVPDLGVLLPCNVCVYVQGGKTVISAMQPKAALSLIPDETVHAVGIEAAARLERVVAAI